MANEDQLPYLGSMHRSTEDLLKWQYSAKEEALEYALPIVDAHHHLYGDTTDTHRYRLVDLERDISRGHRIMGTVYVEGYHSGWRPDGLEALKPVGEVELVAGLTGAPLQTPLGHCEVAAAIVSHADLTLGERVSQVLEAQLEAGQGRLRGVRQIAAHNDGVVGTFMKHMPLPHLLSDPGFRKGFAQLDGKNLAFDAWVYHDQLNEVIDLADAFPDTHIVLDHVGGVLGVAEFRSRRVEVVAQWKKDVRNLAARPNVSVKIGGLGMPMFGFRFEYQERPATSAELAQAWGPFIHECIDAFGTQRCMFESNFPVDKQSCGYTELWNAFKRVTASLSPEQRRDLFYRTACRIYRLPKLEATCDLAPAA